MKRDLARLQDRAFDILIIGSGIYGATIAHAAAKQGLKVALIDKGDFGHSTSANSLKIVHGGLRYLQQLDIRRMRESIRSRRQLSKFAPHLVRPLQCVVPTRGHGLRSRLVMSIALALNDLVSWDRNKGLDSDCRLPSGHTVSADQCLGMIPGLDRDRVTGGAIWFDAMALNTERLNFCFVTSAATSGAVVANYVRASGYIFANESIVGAEVEDMLRGEKFDIKAALVINASGPWANDFADSVSGLRKKTPQSWVRATNIVIKRRLFGDYAVGLSADNCAERGAIAKKGTRDLFFVPWKNGTIVGTFYSRFTGSADDFGPEASDIHSMLRQINAAYPSAKIMPIDVSNVHAGLLPERPGTNDTAGDIQLMKQLNLNDTAQSSNVSGLLSLVGVKYTTAPQVAERVVRMAMSKLGRNRATRILGNRHDSLQSVDGEKYDQVRHEADPAPTVLIDHLRKYYGDEVNAVMRYCTTPEGRDPVGPGQSILAGQVVYSVKHEMAQCLADIVFRRTDLGTFGYPGRDSLVRCAELMAAEFGWESKRVSEEIEMVEGAYSALAEAGCMQLPRHSRAASPDLSVKLTAPAGEH